MIEQLTALPRLRLFLLAAIGIVVVGAIDLSTGPELAFSIFYLLPIALVAWSASISATLAVALTCGAVWLGIEIATHQLSHPAILYWNGAVRTGVFCIVGWMVALVAKRTRELHGLNDSLAQKVAERSAALRDQSELLESVLDSIGEGVVVADTAGRVVKSNPAARRILGAAPPDADRVTEPELEPLRRALLGSPVDAEEVPWFADENRPPQWLALTGRPIAGGRSETKGAVVVVRDVTERRLLERQVAEASDREQRRLGADLHDGVCQQLVGVAFAARLLADKLAAAQPAESRAAAEIVALIDSALGQTRQVSRGLYLSGLESGGLAEALDELAEQVRQRNRLDCVCYTRLTSPVDDPVVCRELYRIAQEAVANALKHGRPRHLQLTLDSDERRILLCIENDGLPFPAAPPNGQGMGLQMMRHRARLLGGTLTLDSTGPAGTEVVCEVPRRRHPSTSAP